MSYKYVLTLATSSLIAVTLTGCATDQAVSNNTQPTLDTAQTTVGTNQTATSLTDSLVQQLGVSPAQASGGAGALLQVAQAKMPGNDFQQLTNSVPEVGSLLNSTTQSSGLSQIAAGASSLIGDESNSLGAIANLAETYQKLGMSSDMVKQFIPIITDYVSKNATPQITQSLISSLTGL